MKKKDTEKKETNIMLATTRDSKFIWQNGADCQKLWRRYGWIPPTEYRTDYEFGKNREKDEQMKGEKWMKI